MYLRNSENYIKYYILIPILTIKLNILLNIYNFTAYNNNIKVI